VKLISTTANKRTGTSKRTGRQTRLYIKKIERVEPTKDTYIQFRVTTAQADSIKRILQQRGITLTDYFTKFIDYEIQKDMNKNQHSLLEILEQK